MPARSVARVTLACVLVALLAAPVSAEQPVTEPDHVEATYTVTFLALDEVAFTADVRVHALVQDGSSYSADDLREQYAQYRAFSEPHAERFVDALVTRMRAKAEAGLADAFPHAETASVTSATVDRGTLERGSASPTIDFRVTARVTLDRAALGIDAYSDEDVDAVFRAGARFLADVRFVAEEGYRVDYFIHAPGALAWEDPNLARVTEDGRTLVAEVDNRGSATRVVANATAWLTHPEHAPAAGEDVRATVTYALPHLALDDGTLPLEAQVVADIHALDLAARVPGALPERVDLRYVTAGDLRDLLARGLVTPTDVAASERALLDDLADAVGDDFDAVAEVDGGFEPASLAASAPADAPVAFVADAVASYAPAALERVADGVDLMVLLDAGARVDAFIPLAAEPGSVTTIVLELPAGARVEDAGAGGVVDATGRSVAWTLDNADGATRVEASGRVRLTSVNAPNATAPDAHVLVLIDVKDVDVSVTQAAGGDFGRLLVDVFFTGDVNAMTVPDAARERLPDGIVLDVVTAEGLRNLVSAGFFTDADVAGFEASVLDTVRARLGTALGVPVNVTGGLDRATLARTAAGATPSPVVFRASSTLTIPLAEGADGASAEAVAFTIVEKAYAFPAMDGLRATYKLLLPRGIALTGAHATGGDVDTGREDGRDWLSVTPTGDAGARAVVAMGVTPAFVLVKFWPVLAAAGAVIALGAGSAVLARRARRRRNRAA